MTKRTRCPKGTPIRDRISRLVDTTGECWIWQGRITSCGYGQMSLPGGRKVYAHRASVEAFRGPIPDGMNVDHICMNKACINPDHLEVVTPSENTRRWWASRTDVQAVSA